MQKILFTLTALLCLSATPILATDYDDDMNVAAQTFTEMLEEGFSPDDAANSLEPLRFGILVARRVDHQSARVQRQTNYCLGICAMALGSAALAIFGNGEYCGTAQAVCTLAMRILPTAGIGTLIFKCIQDPHKK